MNLTPSRGADTRRLGDHSADRRMLTLSAMALVTGSGGALGAWALLKLIAIATNLFWCGRLSDAAAHPHNEARKIYGKSADGATTVAAAPRFSAIQQ